MSNIDMLKRELLNQKAAIENKGGQVVVGNTNPSPAEITAGIQNIPVPNFSDATATEQDVVNGKTFYAGNNVLKVGNYEDATDKYTHLFVYSSGVPTSNNAFTFNVPNNITAIKPYMFYENKNNISVYFHNKVESIGDYAFYGTTNFKFYNFAEMYDLKQVCSYAFANTSHNGVDLESIPSSIVDIEDRAFYNMATQGCSINVPPNVTEIDGFAFASDEIVYCNGFNINASTPISILSQSCLLNLNFNCDLVVPSSVKTISNKFNYNGSFNNIVIPASVATISMNAFGADEDISLSDIKLKTVTFEGVTPPNTGSTIFSSQALQNGLKIYVPDQSVEAYKAKLYNYVDYIYPMSEKN